MEIRALRAEEIECRVQQATAKGVLLLLYKDARCDMAVLDETFTPFGWQRHHELINGKEFCTVSIKSEQGEWISKQDCGTESNTEKTKGETSDAFKRACFNWGIGRELYTKIFIFIPCETVSKGNNKYEMKDRYAKFNVSNIKTDNLAKKILHLEISDKYGKKVFTWDNANPPKYEELEESKKKIEHVKCPVCEEEVKPLVYKGETKTPQQVLDALEMCHDCYDYKQKASKCGDSGSMADFYASIGYGELCATW